MQTQAAVAARLYRTKPYLHLSACLIVSSLAAVNQSASSAYFISRSCPNSISAISADVPFFLAIDRYARPVPCGLSNTLRMNVRWNFLGKDAPFCKPDGEPYLEVHHIRKLSDGGLDHPVNCAAITPDSHREIHFGANGKILDEKLASLISSKETILSQE